MNTADLVRRVRNLLKATHPIPTIINRLARGGVGEESAWALLEEAALLNFREAVELTLPLLKEGRNHTEIKRSLMLKKGFSWLEAGAIFEGARKLWIEEELESGVCR